MLVQLEHTVWPPQLPLGHSLKATAPNYTEVCYCPVTRADAEVGYPKSGPELCGRGCLLLPRGGEDVVEAARLAAAGQPFEVVHYPRASGPEFCVRADAVEESMRASWCTTRVRADQWCPGLRFKMAFEAEDLSRISWFMGTIAGVEPADPERWPQSPWRLLQVIWDEPELLQNVNRVCPWQVELVSSRPNLPCFSPPPPCTPAYTETLSERKQFFDPADHQAPPAPRIVTHLKIGSPTPHSPSSEAA